MNHNFENDMVSLVAKITCPECNGISYIGSEFPAEKMKDASWGLLGYFKKSDRPVFVHCPQCDVMLSTFLDSDGLEWDEIIEDVTPELHVPGDAI